MNISIKTIVVIISYSVLFAAMPVVAAELKFSSSTQEMGINQQFQVDLILDTEDEEINAIEGKILFSADLLELKEIRDGNSIINFWIERPSLNSKFYILYSGIIPGGYLGEGFVFSAIFQAKKEGEGIVEIQDAKILLNDGSGTAANTKISNFEFLISKQILNSKFQILAFVDVEPPEDFKAEIVQNTEMFGGKYFLVFATQDKGMGIDRYEAQENRIQKIENRKWVEAESPYVLKDQKLKSYIYVKAVDKAGNERMVIIPPQNPPKWYENYFILGIIILIVIGYATKILWPRFIKSR